MIVYPTEIAFGMSEFSEYTSLFKVNDGVAYISRAQNLKQHGADFETAEHGI